MSTPDHRKRLGHRAYMREYRQRPEYQRSDRAYNVVEYLVRCLRTNQTPAAFLLQLVGAKSQEDFRRRIERAIGSKLDLASYGVTWFFAHKEPIKSFDFSKPEQFLQCIALENLALGHIAKPWRKPRKNPGDESPPLPGMA